MQTTRPSKARSLDPAYAPTPSLSASLSQTLFQAPGLEQLRTQGVIACLVTCFLLVTAPLQAHPMIYLSCKTLQLTPSAVPETLQRSNRRWLDKWIVELSLQWETQ